MESSKCIYCNNNLIDKKYVLNREGSYKFHACSSDCLQKSKEFNLFEQRNRIIFYALLTVAFLINLYVIYQRIESSWTYLPISLIGVILYFYPLPFTKYVTYEKFGIKKTILGVQIFAVTLIVFGIALYLISSF